MSLRCLFSHKWNGCKCSYCGKVRDKLHDLDLCKGKCLCCGKMLQAEEHEWNDCKCAKCGKTRDERHKWTHVEGTCDEKCTTCGKEKVFHSWDDLKCSVCGADRTKIVKLVLKEWYQACAGKRVGRGICDDCMRPLTTGNSYLRPGGYLCCEKCTDRFLGAEYINWSKAMYNLNSYFGPGLPQEVLDMNKKAYE